MQDQEPKDPREDLRLFCSEQKARAFCDRYSPADDADYDRAITENELRQIFGAHPRPQGDPLIIYLDELLPKSYHLRLDPLCEEMVMFVREK